MNLIRFALCPSPRLLSWAPPLLTLVLLLSAPADIVAQPLTAELFIGQGNTADGVRGNARSTRWYASASDSAGNIYTVEPPPVPDYDYTRVIRKMTPSGEVTTLKTIPGIRGNWQSAVKALAVAPDGTIYFLQGRSVWTLDSAGTITLFAGQTADLPPAVCGPVAVARLTDTIASIAIAPDGTVYVADRAMIFKISGGIVSCLTNFLHGSYPIVDGDWLTAKYDYIAAIAVAPDGTLTVADSPDLGLSPGRESTTRKSVIRRVTADGTVTTWVGGVWSTLERPGPAADVRFARIDGLGYDRQGNLYVGTYSYLFKIAPSGFATVSGGSRRQVNNFVGTGPVAGRYLYNLVVSPDGTVYVNGIEGTGGLRRYTPASGCAIACGGRTDWDNDGKTDLLRMWETGNDLWLGAGTSLIDAGGLDPETDPNWVIRGIGDLDGNGTSDLVLANLRQSQIEFRLMNGTANVSRSTISSFGPDWIVAGVGDFDGDGKSDLLLTDFRNGRHLIWYMNGTTVVHGSAFLYTDPGFRLSGIGDLDGDRIADLVWYNDTTGIIDFHLMTPTGRGQTRSYLAVVYPWTIAAIADFDGDSKADLLWHDRANDRYLIWYMNGVTVAAGSAFIATSPGFILGSVGDLDADGKTDFVWADECTPFAIPSYPDQGEGLSIWLMTGARSGTIKAWGGSRFGLGMMNLLQGK